MICFPASVFFLPYFLPPIHKSLSFHLKSICFFSVSAVVILLDYVASKKVVVSMKLLEFKFTVRLLK